VIDRTEAFVIGAGKVALVFQAVDTIDVDDDAHD
jgi:hypothetical protein